MWILHNSPKPNFSKQRQTACGTSRVSRTLCPNDKCYAAWTPRKHPLLYIYICGSIPSSIPSDFKVPSQAIVESAKMPAREPLSSQNEKQNGSGLWRVCSLEDILKILRWKKTPTALEAEANVLQSEKRFSIRSVNGDANGGEVGLCSFRMPVH